MPTNQNVAIVNNDELRTMRADIEKTGKGATRSAAVVTAADIARMRAAAQVKSDQEVKEEKKIREEQKA